MSRLVAREPLLAHADTTCELGHPDTPLLPFRLYEEDDPLAICHEDKALAAKGDRYLLRFFFVHRWR